MFVFFFSLLAERHSYSIDGSFFTLEIATTKFDDSGTYTVQGRNSLVGLFLSDLKTV